MFRGLCYLYHNLANVLLQFVIRKGVEGLVEVKDLVDDGLGARVGKNKSDHVSEPKVVFGTRAPTRRTVWIYSLCYRSNLYSTEKNTFPYSFASYIHVTCTLKSG